LLLKDGRDAGFLFLIIVKEKMFIEISQYLLMVGLLVMAVYLLLTRKVLALAWAKIRKYN